MWASSFRSKAPHRWLQCEAKFTSVARAIGRLAHFIACTIQDLNPKTLLAAGADVNPKMPDGWTALMGASQKGHVDVVTLLKEAGAQ